MRACRELIQPLSAACCGPPPSLGSVSGRGCSAGARPLPAVLAFSRVLQLSRTQVCEGSEVLKCPLTLVSLGRGTFKGLPVVRRFFFSVRVAVVLLLGGCVTIFLTLSPTPPFPLFFLLSLKPAVAFLCRKAACFICLFFYFSGMV